MATLEAALAAAEPGAALDARAGLAAAQQALQLAAQLRRPDDEARAAAWVCRHRFGLGLLAELCADGEFTLGLLPGEPHRRERCEVLRLLVTAHAERGSFDAALLFANRLQAESDRGGDAGLALLAASTLGALLDRIGDPWQAVRVLTQALALHGAAAPPRQCLISRINLCGFHGDAYLRIRDAGRDAERQEHLAAARGQAEQALALLSPTAEPLHDVAARGNLAEVLLYQGELDRSRALLDAALARAEAEGLRAHHWRMRATLAAWWLARGDAALARVEAESLLADMGEQRPAATEIRARDVAFESCRALGDVLAALDHFVVFERLERRRTLTELRAQSQLFVTRIEAQQAHRQAEQAQEEAALQSRRASAMALLAETDPLTGIGNRAHFERRTAELLALPAAKTAPVVALLDIDRFKSINDEHGHAAGDAVLRGLARLLQQAMRERDIVARVGGEEFVLLMPATPLEAAAEVCERLRREVEAQTLWPPLSMPVQVTVSLGLASVGEHGLDEALKTADLALYAAKHGGRNVVHTEAGATRPGAL